MTRRNLLPPLALLLAFLALLAGALPAADPAVAPAEDSAAAEQASSPPRALLLIEAVNERGETLDDLDPDALRVLRDGVPVDASVTGTAAPDRVVVYFDLPLLTTQQVLGAAGTLSDRAAELVALAEVQLVVGDESSRTVLPASIDPERVSQSLSGVGTRYGGHDGIGEVRTRFLDELRAVAGDRSGDRPPLPAHLVERIERLARESLAAEAELLRDQRERIASWAAEEGSLGPDRSAALILVTGGFDEDPLGFYRAALDAHGLGKTVADRLERPVVLPSLDELGKVLSAYGWLTFPYVASGLGEQEASTEGRRRRGGEEGPQAPGPEDTLSRPGLDPSERDDDQRPALITPRLGGRERDESKGPERPDVRPGREALAEVARAAGGEVVRDALQLPDLLDRLARRQRVTVATVPGEPERIEVELADGAGDGVTLRAPRWTGETPPRSLAAVRVRRLLERQEATGGALPVEAAFEPPPSGSAEGRLTVRLGAPGETPPEPGTPLRATVGIARFEGDPLIFHRELEGGAGDGGLFEIPIPLSQGDEPRLAVLVEELPRGRSGSAFATRLETADADDGDGLDPGVLPSPRVVRLITPGEPFVVGATTFSAVVSTARVERVDFFLDGRRVAARTDSPFEATMDMGPVPDVRRIEAVAYGEGGEELGRDTLVVNRGGGSFRVRIVEPLAGRADQTGDARGTDEPLVGPVDVEAQVSTRGEQRVDRVEFFWNTERVATRYGPPFRQRVVIPGDAPEGFVRVVAYLEDGAAAEDVLFLNSPGTGERLDVNLVEMYVLVTDEDGRPVTGLGPEDFRVSEEGEPQEIATFRSGADLPLTVGLAIDSSASMFVKLPEVERAAREFVSESLEGGDRAFVVGFGGEPELVQETTGDETRLSRSIARLRPVGQTALWESIVYSLVEIQGAPGKKALIVYTDGADEDEDFSYRTALKFSRRVGVPIYFILTNNEIVRTGGKGLGVRRFLGRVERLAEEVGGKLFIVRRGEDLAEVYREIGEELRSQYLLAYYSRDLPAEETWRRVDVETVLDGLETRTITGTYR